jgi:hypothetical protein
VTTIGRSDDRQSTTPRVLSPRMQCKRTSHLTPLRVRRSPGPQTVTRDRELSRGMRSISVTVSGDQWAPQHHLMLILSVVLCVPPQEGDRLSLWGMHLTLYAQNKQRWSHSAASPSPRATRNIDALLSGPSRPSPFSTARLRCIFPTLRRAQSVNVRRALPSGVLPDTIQAK